MSTALPFQRPFARGNLAPGPRGIPLLGTLPNFVWGDPVQTLMDACTQFGDVVRLPFGPFHFYAVNNPDLVRYVLQDNRGNYPKSRNADELRVLLGNGMLLSDGDFWLRQRRLAQPAFHRQKLTGFARSMVDATDAMLDRWEPVIARGGTVEFVEEAMRLALDIVGRTLFSTRLDADAGDIGPALTCVMKFVNTRSTRLFRVPSHWEVRARPALQHALATLDAKVNRLIAEHRRALTPPDDLLTMLLEARDEETGASMSDAQLRDEVMTLLLAGHETTANALAWGHYLLSAHPDVRDRVAREAESTFGEEIPTADGYPKMKYTRAVADEILRLYPPAWFVDRVAAHDDTLGGYDVHAGTPVAVVPYALHRHPAYWDNPEAFDPARFLDPERIEARPKYAYIPFGAGPRMCIGNAFALMEINMVLARLAQRVRIDLVPGFVPATEPLITLRPRHAMHVRVSPVVRTTA